MSSQAVSLNYTVKNTDEDIHLIKSSIEGNADAFRDLFMRHVSRIYSLCLRISADTYIAEELTQEVFIKAWERLRSFKFESKFSSWLHAIAVNEFLMYLRSEKRSALKHEAAGSNEINRPQYRQDSNMDIENAIGKLPEQARTVLVLHDVEGYNHKEIAEMMSIQPGTSKAHLHRARKILREELSK